MNLFVFIFFLWWKYTISGKNEFLILYFIVRLDFWPYVIGRLNFWPYIMERLNFWPYVMVRMNFGPYIMVLLNFWPYTDPSKCINDQTLRSDTEFWRTSLLKLSDQIVRQMSDQILPGRSESLHSQIVKL